MGASGAAHVPYQGAKHLLLAFEIGVEGAEGDAGAGRDAGDRRFVIAALANFPRRRLQPATQRLALPFGPRRPAGVAGLAPIGLCPTCPEIVTPVTLASVRQSSIKGEHLPM